MKHKLILLPVIALMTCSSNSSVKLNSHDVSITDYHWKLINAKKSSQKIIPELSNTNMRVTFTHDGMNFSGGCNRFTSSINLTKENFKTSTMASTRMACEERLMRQDELMGNFFDGQTIQYTVRQDNNRIMLTLKNSKGEVFTLEGSPSNELLYGNDKPETFFIEISASQSMKCQAQPECYQYRFVTYDDKYNKQYSEWQPGLPQIKNYTKNPDFREIVRVKKFSKDIYVFDMLIERENLK